MKVYACPDEIPAPEIDFKSFDLKKLRADEEQHQARLKAWLIARGYTGKNTGELVSFPVADGYAQYMFADGKSPALIHLPYGDAYQYPHIQYLPKAEILKNIERRKGLAKLFGKK